jgi:transcriptional regulator with XRE-family HTH domain
VTGSQVRQLGVEADAAKRLRQAWGNSIRDTRTLKGWTLDKLAQEMGGIVSAAAIGMWERGVTAPRWHHQIAVAKALGIPHARLFAITDEAA